MNRNCFAAMAGVVLVAGCNSQPTGVGSYIFSDTDGAVMVQITSTKDGQVSGSWSVVKTFADGKTKAGSRPLSGTIEGNALNLTVENSAGPSLVTGTVDGDNLRLTIFVNGKSSKVTLAKSDASKFEKLANGQRSRAQEKLQETEAVAASKNRIKQRSKTQESIDRLADGIVEKSQEVQEKSKRVDIIAAEHRVAYSRAGKMRSAKQKLNAESADGGYRISQLDYEIDRISNDRESIHARVQSYMESLNEFVSDTDAKSSQFLAECEADELLNCSRLSPAKQTLTVKYQLFQKGYERENAAYIGNLK